MLYSGVVLRFYRVQLITGIDDHIRRCDRVLDNDMHKQTVARRRHAQVVMTDSRSTHGTLINHDKTFDAMTVCITMAGAASMYCHARRLPSGAVSAPLR